MISGLFEVRTQSLDDLKISAQPSVKMEASCRSHGQPVRLKYQRNVVALQFENNTSISLHVVQ